MSDELLKYLPQQWVGLIALLMFGVYIALQLIEKYPLIAKIFPFGVWWHEHQKKKVPRLNEAIEDNEVIVQLRSQMSGVVKDAEAQWLQIASLQQQVRAFRAWSEYDARWHHRISIENAARETCLLPPHHDFFEFEQLWRADPVSAARL